MKVAEVSAKVEGLQTDLMVKLSEVTDQLATTSVQPVCRQNTDSSRKVAVAPSQAMEHDLERRNNLVVFGLEEKNSTLELKSDVEDLRCVSGCLRGPRSAFHAPARDLNLTDHPLDLIRAEVQLQA